MIPPQPFGKTLVVEEIEPKNGSAQRGHTPPATVDRVCVCLRLLRGETDRGVCGGGFKF